MRPGLITSPVEADPLQSPSLQQNARKERGKERPTLLHPTDAEKASQEGASGWLWDEERISWREGSTYFFLSHDLGNHLPHQSPHSHAEFKGWTKWPLSSIPAQKILTRKCVVFPSLSPWMILPKKINSQFLTLKLVAEGSKEVRMEQPPTQPNTTHTTKVHAHPFVQ